MSNLLQTHDFLRLDTRLPHEKQNSKLSSIVDFGFKVGDKPFIRLSNKDAAYWWKETNGGLGFRRTSLKTSVA